MEAPTTTTTTTHHPPLQTLESMRRAAINRAFAVVYTCAIFALFYHHAVTVLQSTTLFCFSISFSLFISDVVLAFMWATAQCFRMRPVGRRAFIENLEKVMTSSDFPALDVFICTADPYKEPPMTVVNTALSVMAYDYPTEKISVYVSDDGGSEITLFALMEAAKFASHWLPFCREHNIEERCPEAYFKNNHNWHSEILETKVMYESMKIRVENVMERNKVGNEYINCEGEREAFNKWTNKFTSQDHPTVIQILLESGNDKDITGYFMPNLIYISRQKCRTSPHNFKAGALNTLLRVSATMTNAPIILTLDCDMYSNDPRTPQRMLCYFSDHAIRSNLGYVQFPQRFHGINKNDIYACDYTRMFQIYPLGMDGLGGPDYEGTGCFFSRRALFGGPSSFVYPDIVELSPDYVVTKHITSRSMMALTHHVAGCNYENETNWGSKVGFRYGSLVEDTNTGYRLQCEGWKSVFCHPERAAFLGDAPINLTDVLIQTKRWSVGLLQMGFSRYSPLTFGTRVLGSLMGLCYSHYALWPIWTIPITTYAFLPQLALLNGLSIFPKVSNPWFLLYAFLFLGAYIQDFLEFMLAGGTIQRWWNDQRMWMIRGVTCYLFGSLDYMLKSFGMSMLDFNVTSKATHIEEQSNKRYQQGIFDFEGGSQSHAMFVPLTMAAIINLISFSDLFVEVLRGRCLEELFAQMFITSFVLANCFPIYEAMIFRTDRGRIPCKVSLISTVLALALYTIFSFTLWLST